MSRAALKPFALLLALVCLALAAMQPFLTGAFPQTADGTLHLYRLISLDHAIRHGEWGGYAPGMVFGYGAPFFSYYAPLSLYPLEALHLLGLAFVDAWLWGMALYALLGAAGAYLLGARWTGTVGGLVSAAAYAYAPYTLFDSLWRGSVSEMAALALLPWALWAFDRLAQTPDRWRFVTAVVAFALFIPMHNVITLYGAGLLAVYGAFLGWRKPKALLLLAAAYGLALALTAFFWLPALSETDFVKINAITASLPDIDVVRNLLPPGAVLAPPLTADPTQMQPPVPIALGWPQLVLGALALLLVTQRPTESRLRPLLWLAALGALLLACMTTQPSALLWRILPLVRYSQFPWRLLGPASLLLALLAGAGAALIARRMASNRLKMGWLAFCLLLVMLYAVPWLYTIYLPAPPAENIVDAQNFERETGWIATSSFGEYLPRWNGELPDPQRLAARYAERAVIPRLEAPPGLVIRAQDWRLTGGTLTVTAEREMPLTFDWFYFPGWHVLLDGREIEARPGADHGLLEITLPAGEHRLELWLGPTPAQQAGRAISFAALVLLLLALPVIPRRTDNNTAAYVEFRLLLAAALVGVGLLAGKALVIDKGQSPFKRERFAAGVEAGVQFPIMANFADQITLLGYDLPQGEVASGGAVALNLYWRAEVEAIESDYSSLVTLRDSAGHEVARAGSFYPGGLATRHWLRGYYIQDRLALTIPPGTPPGVYRLEAALYDPQTARSLDLINAAGNPEDIKVRLGMLTVIRPAQAQSIEIGQPLNADVTEALTLAGVDPLPEEAQVGQALDLTWYWQAEAVPQAAVRARLVWLDAQGQVAAVTPDLPPALDYPLSNWQAGDVWRGRHTVYVPGSLQAGGYTLAVEAAGRQIPLGEMQISAPERSFTLPEDMTRADIAWENGIRLAGYTAAEEGGALTLTLYWQTERDLTTSLHLFAHVVGTEGRIFSQAGGIPASWTRPTTGWMPGEIITETYTLPIPAGVYEVRLGWFNPLDGQRIPIGAGDFWALPLR